MKRFALGLAAFFATVSPVHADVWGKFFQKMEAPGEIAPLTEKPELIASTGVNANDQIQMWQRGFTAIGNSSFNGPSKNPKGALKQAQKIGARYVLTQAQYVSTTSGAIPLTIPSSSTTSTNGSVSLYGRGAPVTGDYSGTSTTYGTQTTLIPYSVSRFDQNATYYAPVKRTGSGILARALTDQEKATFGTNRGLVVGAVREGSPAHKSEILPGDVILKLNGEAIDVAVWKTFMSTSDGRVAVLTIMRRSGHTTINMPITPEG